MGSAPAWTIEFAVAIKENGVVMTSLPCPMFRACMVIERAAVPDAVETAYFVPQY